MTAHRPNGLEIDGQFASRLVHDLRGSLRAVSTLPEWIAEDLEPLSTQVAQDVYRYLSEIKSKAERADRLILSVREFCNIDTTCDCLAEGDVSEAIQSAITQFQWPIGFEVTADLVKQKYLAPQASLERVLYLLFDNASRHHGQDVGNIHVTNSGTHGAIWVSDDGQGILEEYHEQVFEPFTTLRPQDVVEGSGFGLSIARKYAQSWNGGLRIMDNVKGDGMMFEVSFPVQPKTCRL
jgi:signal transduction histidine kinase